MPRSPIASAVAELSATFAALSAELGARVEATGLGVLDRTGQLPLAEPGQVSPNGACRLLRAADGWMAVNLARPEDRELLPAWVGGELPAGDLEALAAAVARQPSDELVAQAALLGLPAARVGEVSAPSPDARLHRIGQPLAGARRIRGLKVLDLTALWAGPMCGALLAAAGAEVTRVESLSRPDPTRHATPEFFRRLNGMKAEVALDLATAGGRAGLARAAAAADVVISSARPRGLSSLGLSPEAFLRQKPGAVWVAISGYGIIGPQSGRVAFGDDAAAAGGLVRWTRAGEPRFLGDALADPLTGLAAAAGALQALRRGGAALVDAALARCAAGAAAMSALASAA
jgi:crotonobetainyl-CoA:carnitine CoA-transferase CaiB-like acyl-CoA transferase